VARTRAEPTTYPRLIGTPDQLVERVARYAAAGTDELIIPDFNLAPTQTAETVERFMTEVAAAL
jgi:alkanesulfonate monooxygenase SsuD/methylene tetrahydromethanopterin reductase-like flavin-dependent oxidoreductase (luciferase family)